MIGAISSNNMFNKLDRCIGVIIIYQLVRLDNERLIVPLIDRDMLPELTAVLTVVGRESFHEIKDERTISYITKSQ